MAQTWEHSPSCIYNFQPNLVAGNVGLATIKGVQGEAALLQLRLWGHSATHISYSIQPNLVAGNVGLATVTQGEAALLQLRLGSRSPQVLTESSLTL